MKILINWRVLIIQDYLNIIIRLRNLVRKNWTKIAKFQETRRRGWRETWPQVCMGGDQPGEWQWHKIKTCHWKVRNLPPSPQKKWPCRFYNITCFSWVFFFFIVLAGGSNSVLTYIFPCGALLNSYLTQPYKKIVLHILIIE